MENLVRHVHHDSSGVYTALSLDGTKVIWSSYAHPAQIWSTETQRSIPLRLQGCQFVPSGDAVFSPSGKLICLTSRFHDRVTIWDGETGKAVSELKSRRQHTVAVAFSPNDRFIALFSEDVTIQIFDVITSRLIRGHRYDHTDEVTQVVFSPVGKKVASNSTNAKGTIRIWDTSNVAKLSPDHSSQELPDPFTSECILKNGWVMTPKKELLFWVPPSNRKGLWWPRNTAVISETSTKLDLTKFEHGDSWEKCRG